MGAKDWMLLYADGEIRPILQAAPPIDRNATRKLVGRLYSGHRISEIEDRTLESSNPPERHIYAGCFPGLTVICTGDAALDRPSELDRRFVDEALGRTLYLHVMHSVVDWFAYAIWSGDGTLSRSLSVSPDDGVLENIGEPLPFERPFWAGERNLDPADDDLIDFHPLELAEEALRALFGFSYEGYYKDDDPALERIVLSGFLLSP